MPSPRSPDHGSARSPTSTPPSHCSTTTASSEPARGPHPPAVDLRPRTGRFIRGPQKPQKPQTAVSDELVRLLRFSRHQPRSRPSATYLPIHLCGSSPRPHAQTPSSESEPGWQRGRGAESPRAAGLVIVAVHAGTEYDTEPNSDQVTDAHTLLASPDIDPVYGTTRASSNPCGRSTGNG